MANNGIIPSDAPKTYTIESGGVTLPIAARVGYDFSGWYDTPEFSGNPITMIAPNSIGDRTFYAKWTPKIYTITYILNGGTLPTALPRPTP